MNTTATAPERSEYERTVERFEREISISEWPSILEALDSDESPAFAEWADLDEERPLGEIMRQLALIKVNVPETNAEDLKETHNLTLENHIKLALAVAGNRDNLATFLELIQSRLESRPGEAQERLAKQVMWIWLGAAEVAGLSAQKTQLEKTMFPILYPEESALIDARYRDVREDDAAREQLEYHSREIYDLIHDDLQDLGRCDVEVRPRKKTNYSVWQKYQKKLRLGEVTNLDDFELSDFMGLRVVVRIEASDSDSEPIGHCYAARGLICDYYEPDMERTKDYIQSKKANGYQSLHLTLRSKEMSAPLEVQIRTAEMHRLAEEAPEISHIGYEAAEKFVPGTYENSRGKKDAATFRWRDEIAECIRQGRLDGWSELRRDYILMFTPDGNLHEVPFGSTALDGAFAIHTRRALRTKGIKVNGKQTAHEQPLNFGDCIDVTYDKKARWTPDWRDQVTTDRARKKLYSAWKQAEAPRLIARARARVEEFCLTEWGLEDPFAALTPEDERKLARKYSAETLEGALVGIGAGDAVGRDDDGNLKRRGIGRIVNQIRINEGLPMPKRQIT